MSCIECGKPDNRFNFLCQECYLNSNPIIETRPRLKILICRYCMAPSIKTDIWYEFASTSLIDIKSTISKSIADLIDLRFKIKPLQNKTINILDIDDIINSMKQEEDLIHCNAIIKGIPEFNLPEISVSEYFDVYIKYRKCKSCQLLSTGGAIKAKVQIRCVKKLVKIVENSLNELYDLSKQDSISQYFPLEETKLKDGWDLSFKDRKGADYIVQHFKEQYGVLVIETKETTSYDRIKNKARSRIVFSIRLPPYIPGDIVLIEDLPYQVLKIKSNQTLLFDFAEQTILTKENEFLINSNVKNLYSNDELSKYLVISIDEFLNSFQIMNLSTYEIFEESISSLPTIKENQEILAFFWEDNLYISRFNTENKSMIFENDEKVFG